MEALRLWSSGKTLPHRGGAVGGSKGKEKVGADPWQEKEDRASLDS